MFDRLRSADIAIANLEGVFFDLKSFQGYAPGSPYNLLGKPELAAELKPMGIRMVAIANNHSSDWDIQGMQAMTALLDRAGIVHAGDGANLKEAQAPRFLDTPKGRIALISTASTFKQGARAQDAVDDVPARPGISTLRLRETTIVTPQIMKALRSAYDKPDETGDLTLNVASSVTQVRKVYRTGNEPHLSYEMNTYDRDALLRAVREARRQADYVVFTIHAHENADGMDDQAAGDPADFLVQLAHDVIDAGADVFQGTGPHCLRGVEVYRGKPVFYGLAVFLFKGNVVLTQDQRTESYGAAGERQTDIANPKDQSFRYSESWDDSVIAMTTFSKGRLADIRLYPIEHGRDQGPAPEERTQLAGNDKALRILKDLQRLSAPYHTKIDIDNFTGIIRPLAQEHGSR
jgi:poly-gamma-glutamate synthesis protein (capsule biosynthesis protein)